MPTIDYDTMLLTDVEDMLARIADRTSPEDIERIRQAYFFAKEAHAPQRRKSGEPYIIHPVAVARIIALELQLTANPIIAGFLHDVVEDTPHTLDEIEDRFGPDVRFLVDVVTKRKYLGDDGRKQESNFRQLLKSLQYDIRAVLIKLADRLHNMRTLASMKPAKQMKIAGETDFFYAPFANRLGLHSVRRELENLSFKYRCPDRYERLCKQIETDQGAMKERLDDFTDHIEKILKKRGVIVRCEVRWRQPYSIYKSMSESGRDFQHVDYRHIIRLIYNDESRREGSEANILNDKSTCLKIYSILTDHFKEMPGSMVNYIDNPKENGYQSLHIRLLSDHGVWEEIHISSERMVQRTRLGLILDHLDSTKPQPQYAEDHATASDNIWLDKFRSMLQDVDDNNTNALFMESVVAALYSEDITVYDTEGHPTRLPQGASAIDYAFEIGKGEHAQYARVNGRLSSLRMELHHGDMVEIGTNPESEPHGDWLSSAKTYKARNFLRPLCRPDMAGHHRRCEHCRPLPGHEVIGFKEDNGTITLHRRDCQHVISQAAQQGDRIVNVLFPECESVSFPVKTRIRGVDRYHILQDIVACLSDRIGISFTSLQIATVDEIFECTIDYSVHSAEELRRALRYLAEIDGVDEVSK